MLLLLNHQRLLYCPPLQQEKDLAKHKDSYANNLPASSTSFLSLCLSAKRFLRPGRLRTAGALLGPAIASCTGASSFASCGSKAIHQNYLVLLINKCIYHLLWSNCFLRKLKSTIIRTKTTAAAVRAIVLSIFPFTKSTTQRLCSKLAR